MTWAERGIGTAQAPKRGGLNSLKLSFEFNLERVFEKAGDI
jgi:hypothetical protein